MFFFLLHRCECCRGFVCFSRVFVTKNTVIKVVYRTKNRALNFLFVLSAENCKKQIKNEEGWRGTISLNSIKKKKKPISN